MRRKERLGLAYTRLNCWEWDDFVDEKPEGFDDLSSYAPDKTLITKSYYITPKMNEIRNEIGEAACSRYWWKFKLKRNYFQWIFWWASHGRSFTKFIKK